MRPTSRGSSDICARARRDATISTASRGRRGFFVVLEGIEGSGKTTQAARLARLLEKAGLPVVTTREPGGTRLGEAVRRLLIGGALEPVPLAELFLFEACRSQVVQGVIKPALREGKIVVSDRFDAGSVAYQGFGRELGRPLVERVNRLATGGLRPDLTIILDLEPRLGLARCRRRRRLDRFERQQVEFHRRVREGYLRLAASAPRRYTVIDAARDVDLVAADVQAAVLSRLRRRGFLGKGQRC